LEDRATPLVIEAGDDQKSWRQLADRPDVFQVWKAKFPSTTARYVRVRATRTTLLHFDAVKVFR
jgi:hypothetical protein